MARVKKCTGDVGLRCWGLKRLPPSECTGGVAKLPYERLLKRRIKTEKHFNCTQKAPDVTLYNVCITATPAPRCHSPTKIVAVLSYLLELLIFPWKICGVAAMRSSPDSVPWQHDATNAISGTCHFEVRGNMLHQRKPRIL